MRYVVYMTTYHGELLPKYYIGSTSYAKITSGKYYGSVKSNKWKHIFKEELKNNPQLFTTEILSYHSNRQEALQEEYRIQTEKDVLNSSLFFNEALASPRGFFGRGCVTENQKKMASERMKRMNRGEIPGRKKGNNKSGKHQDNSGEKNPMYGKKHKIESKIKNSESVKKSRENKVKCVCGKEIDFPNFQRWHKNHTRNLNETDHF